MSATNQVNVKRLLSKVKKDLSKTLENYLFDVNDDMTKTAVQASMTQYLDSLKSKRAIYDYNVVCNASNNPPYDAEHSLLQGLSEEMVENHLIESDENEVRLFYHDILYRTLNKKDGKITSYFEEHQLTVQESNSLQVDVFLKPAQAVNSVVMNFKLG